MAEYLNNSVLRAGAWGCVVGAFFALLPACAETLPDPTRPPVGFGQNQVVGADMSAPVLQSILISPNRRIAIISGKTLQAGDKFGEAQLVAISENEVVLRTGKESQVLKLYPSLNKQRLKGRTGSNFDSPGQQR